MATARNLQLAVDGSPVYYRPGLSDDLAKKASDLLQTNHDRFHIFFNSDGFHNHIAHQTLSLFALSASTEDLQKAYDANVSYQRRPFPVQASIVGELDDPDKFLQYLGPEKYYNDYLAFFANKIEEIGWQETLQKYMFAGDEQAETMLVRMFAGFLHPIIHLGFGIEFQQPAIIAEALAQAACHDTWIGDLLLLAEKAAANDSSTKNIAGLLDEIRADKELSQAPRWSDGNKVRDGIIARAGHRMINIAAQVHVKPEELERKTAEMTNAVCYYTAGAQHPPNAVMFDFYYMHCTNCSIFFPAFLKQAWLSVENKVRLLEWKIRMDLAMYASRRSPAIRLDDIRSYTPREPSGWDGIEDRVCRVVDDGHAPKLIRALASGQRVCESFDDLAEFRVKRDDWLQMGHMAIDSVEDAMARSSGGTWVRSAGFEEAWEDVPLRAQL